MADLDPRTHAYRPDLAARVLEGQVSAAQFSDGQDMQVCTPLAPLHTAASPDAVQVSEALQGEIFHVYEVRDRWAWGQLARDKYVGYMLLESLDRTPLTSTHKVIAGQTLVFGEEDIKAPAPARLGLNAEIAVSNTNGKLSRLASGGFIVSGHIAPLGHRADDFVAVAEMFLGAPYLWGGKSAAGIDCSGLVQISLQAHGIEAPRDSDMQQAELGRTIDQGDLDGLRRGDLVFWDGHVAIVAGSDRLLHANAHHMATFVEPLSPALNRIAKAAGPVRRIARIGS